MQLEYIASRRREPVQMFAPKLKVFYDQNSTWCMIRSEQGKILKVA